MLHNNSNANHLSGNGNTSKLCIGSFILALTCWLLCSLIVWIKSLSAHSGRNEDTGLVVSSSQGQYKQTENHFLIYNYWSLTVSNPTQLHVFTVWKLPGTKIRSFRKKHYNALYYTVIVSQKNSNPNFTPQIEFGVICFAQYLRNCLMQRNNMLSQNEQQCPNTLDL